jgi:hypothetical protein
MTSPENAMSQPLTRDQQIHLMETAPQRMEQRFAAWMRDPRFRAAVTGGKRETDAGKHDETKTGRKTG